MAAAVSPVRCVMKTCDSENEAVLLQPLYKRGITVEVQVGDRVHTLVKELL